MSAKDIPAGRGREDERRAGRRFAIILAASVLLLFALTVGALYAIFKARLRQNNSSPKSRVVSSK